MTEALAFLIFLISLSWTLSPVATAWISGVDPTGWRPHPFLAAYFFDYQSSPNYELTYCFQTVSLFFFSMSVSSFDTVCVAFFMQVAAQFRILLMSLRRLQEVGEESLACSMMYSKAEDGNAVGPSSTIPGGSTDCQQEALKKHVLQYLKYLIKHHNDIIM
ncbi:hypothetical protein PR048_004615 [Dryococelus australis]|uniref:Uncharacterized protein n=1 Tax=Dryococelus australis TaxID=614101 RepID=A0ABQ9I5X8_9NEOP|nr:hypothetical protein PR048_004615 [Dryococelus australis]